MSSTANTASPSMERKPSTKGAKSKIITIHLSPNKLRSFPHEIIAPVNPRKASSSSTSTPSSSTIVAPALSNNPSESNAATPTPSAAATLPTTVNGSLAPPLHPAKKKAQPGPKPGMKRSHSQLGLDGAPKPRGKPGPKKKVKLDPSHPDYKGPFAGPAPLPKLGPKANQGAINAGLRALDRTGKPCRKWQKSGFSVKSFTGISWGAPSWITSRKPEFAGDVKSDSSASSDAKANGDSSAIASDEGKSNGITEANTPNPHHTDVASSPAPAIPAAG